MKIHHATQKRADSYGLTITQDGTNFVVAHGERILATDKDPKTAVKAATDWIDQNGVPTDEDKDEEGMVKRKYRPGYALHDDTCGDDVAEWLHEHTTDEDGEFRLALLEKVADKCAVDHQRFDHLNPGHKRMCVGNIIRAMHRRGELKLFKNGKVQIVEAE